MSSALSKKCQKWAHEKSVKKEHIVQNAGKTGNEECFVQKNPKMSTWSKKNVKKELLIQNKPNNLKKELLIQKKPNNVKKEHVVQKKNKKKKNVVQKKQNKKQRSTWSKTNKQKNKGASGPKEMSKRSTWSTAVSLHHHFPASLFYLSPPNNVIRSWVVRVIRSWASSTCLLLMW